MSNKLPKHIKDAIISHSTSIGDSPCIPPEEEEQFLLDVENDCYQTISQGINTSDINALRNEVSKLLSRVQKIELKNKEALERLSLKSLTQIFDIPSDTIELSMKLVDVVDVSSHRMTPEHTPQDFSFEDIEDMTNLTNYVYKRRMLNCLINGCAFYYAMQMNDYVKDLFMISPELPNLYYKLLRINNLLLFLDPNVIKTLSNNNDAGKEDVYIYPSPRKSKIEAEGIVFPILLSESIKGVLELAISHGLPKDTEKAKYVLSKADFRLADVWDLRLGFPLWGRIMHTAEKCKLEKPFTEIGVNFFFMYIAELPYDEFCNTLQEIFKGTNKGRRIMQDICDEIVYNREMDNFNDYINVRNSKVALNDGYFSSDELKDDDSMMIADDIVRE